MNVYVPDELKVRLDRAGLPLSPLARQAWERELRRAEAAEEVAEMRVDAVDETGAEVELRFQGEKLAGGVYRTHDGRAVLVTADGLYKVWSPGEIRADQDAFSDDVWNALRSTLGGHPSLEFTDVLRAFGVKPVIQL